MTIKCPRCDDCGWVCENHPDQPFSGGNFDCQCGGAGTPCPDCNSGDEVRDVTGFTPIVSIKPETDQ